MGYVYILTNPSLKKNWVKVGQTVNVTKRLRDLYTTGVPLPFEVYATAEADGYLELEKTMHISLGFAKSKINKEFFKVSPQRVYKLLQEHGKVYNAKILGPDFYGHSSIKTFMVSSNNGGNFKFSKVGIAIGSTLTFVGNPSIKVKVVDDSKVSYNNEIWSLSALAKELKGVNYGLRGPDFFSYDGVKLTKISKK